MRQFSCISLLLLLSVLMALHISPSVATARRREFLVAAIGDQGLDDQATRTMNIILTDAPEVAVEDAEETTAGRGRRRMYERLNYRRFGTRKNPSQDHFSGRIPFTSDYGRIKRHPPKHN